MRLPALLLATSAVLGCHASPPSTARSSAAPSAGADASVSVPPEPSTPQRSASGPIQWLPLPRESSSLAPWSRCGDLAERVARALRIPDPAACAITAYAHERERMWLVTVIGPAQDCPSGCFHNHASAIVRGDTVLATRNGYPPQPYVAVRDRLQTLMHERQASGPDLGARFDFYEEPTRVPCANHHERLVLESDGNEVYWSLHIAAETRCTAHRHDGPTGFVCDLAGEIRFPLRGEPDYERFSASCR